MLKFIVKLFNSLNSNSNPGEIAHAISCAFLLGLMPKNNLLWYLIFIFCAFLRINKAAYGLFVIIFSIFAPLTDSILDSIGYTVLTFAPLENFYQFLLNIPFVAFTNFNNTIVMGSLIIGLILYLPLYLISKGFIYIWRKKISSKLLNSKLSKVIKKIPLFNKIANLKSKIGDLK